MNDHATVSDTLESFKVSLGLMMSMPHPNRIKNPVWQMAYAHAADQLDWLLDMEADMFSDDEQAFLDDANKYMVIQSLEILHG